MAKPFSVEIPIRFRDVDMMGHVNNAVYLTYMETARTYYYLALVDKSSTPSGAGEFDWILARAELDFKDAARLGETVVVTVWPSRIGNSSWDFAYRMTEKAAGRVLVEGTTVQVMYDYKAAKTKALPPSLRAKLEAAMALARNERLELAPRRS